MSAPSPRTHFALGVVILGAGASSRMGRPKLLLPWGETTIVGHVIAQWRKLDAGQISVVCGAEDRRLQQELDRAGLPRKDRVVNPAPERGMMSSIRCAAGWTGGDTRLTHWAIALGDQPHLQIATLRAAAGFAALNPGCICQPSRNGRPRHPVFLPAAILRELALASEENLKAFLLSRATSRRLIELEDTGLNLDLDEPADYERALKMAFPG
jgi:molybdenum cofactor cytidylyltransferase